MRICVFWEGIYAFLGRVCTSLYAGVQVQVSRRWLWKEATSDLVITGKAVRHTGTHHEWWTRQPSPLLCCSQTSLFVCTILIIPLSWLPVDKKMGVRSSQARQLQETPQLAPHLQMPPTILRDLALPQSRQRMT